MASAAAPDLPGPGRLFAASPSLLTGRRGPRPFGSGIAAGLAVRRPWWLLRHRLLVQRMRAHHRPPAGPARAGSLPGAVPSSVPPPSVPPSVPPSIWPLPALPLPGLAAGAPGPRIGSPGVLLPAARTAAPPRTTGWASSVPSAVVPPRRPPLSAVAYVRRGEPFAADVRAADLRVLGGVLTPAPDPGAGAVRFDPPRPGPIPARTPDTRTSTRTSTVAGYGAGAAAGSRPGTAPVQGAAPGTGGGGRRGAEDRWRAAVSAQPLETPRPFPAALSPVLRSMRGGAGPAPRYTSGPATRAALEAAGALGASTGSVVHLPDLPAPGGPARLFGVLAHELAHTRQPLPRTRFLLRTPDAAADAEERAAHRTGQAAQRLATAPSPPGTPAVHSPGLVARLPVGGAAGLAGGLAGALGAAGPQGGPVPPRAAAGADTPPAPSPQWTGTAPGWPGEGVWRMLEDTPPDTTAEEPAAPPPQDTTAETAHQHGTTATAGPSGPKAPAVDLDALVQAVEERIVRQIERRGGRYAGLF